jgi:hypothetical protein
MDDDIILYRNDSPGGEFITDSLAIEQGYANKEEMAADLIENSGYSTTPVLLSDGSGISGGSEALLALSTAEDKVLGLLREFLGLQSTEGLYEKPTAEGPKFTQEEAEYVPTLDEAKNLYPYPPPPPPPTTKYSTANPLNLLPSILVDLEDFKPWLERLTIDI